MKGNIISLALSICAFGLCLLVDLQPAKAEDVREEIVYSPIALGRGIWVVMNDNSLVYDRPSREGKLLGRLQAGARVVAEGTEQGFINVVSSNGGYVPISDVYPLSAPVRSRDQGSTWRSVRGYRMQSSSH